LQSTGVDDRAIDELAKLKHLERLTICYTAISKEGITKLGNFKNLKYVVFAPSVSQEAIAAFRKMLPNCEVHFWPD
jgi:hypothetical protein